MSMKMDERKKAMSNCNMERGSTKVVCNCIW